MVPSSIGWSGSWYPLVREPFGGAWQRNMEISSARAMTFYADFACKTLIARDVAKLPVRLVEKTARGIWEPVSNPAFSPVLRKPNHYQTRNQFWESWMLSKLNRGNTYVLKVRDQRRVVTALYVLNPDRVQLLVAEDGSVFYRLSTDDMRQRDGELTVPSTEIIHDRWNMLFHQLVGLPPIWANALASTQGLNIQNQSVRLFANNARPSGILTAPGEISDDTANRLKALWEQNYGGDNFGKVAVVGDDLKYVPLVMNADDAQLIEQLKWTAEVVASTYHVPPWKIGVGALPSTTNVQALEQIYYSSCLQSLIEDAEACLDEGLGLGEQFNLGVEFDITNLLRMDSGAQADFVTKLVGGGVMTPNEGRLQFNLGPIGGGDTVYMQQQDVPMSVAASIKEHPLAAKPEPAPDDDEDSELEDDVARALLTELLRKQIAEGAST
jgi:HK97 family phage portal protein